MKNKDFSKSVAENIGEFVYRSFPEYQDEIFAKLQNILSLLHILIILVIVGLFI